MRYTKNFHELNPGKIDCFVSTDAAEIDEILSQHGFYGMVDMQYANCAAPLETFDVPLSAAMETAKYIGFVPQARIEIRIDRQNRNNIIGKIDAALANERQNRAYADDG